MSMLYRLFILYVLVPKLDLIPMGGSAVRVTDLIFVAAFVLYLQVRGFRFPKIAMANRYLAFIVCAMISVIVNSKLFDLFTMLNILRLLQYLFWAYIGYDAVRYLTPARFVNDMQYVAIFLFLWVVLETLQIIPKFGKFTSAIDRASGNTAGPFEIAVVGSFLAFVTRAKVTKLSSFAIVLMSQARITIVVTALLLLRRYWRAVLPLAVIALPILLFVPLDTAYKQTRFSMLPDVSDIYRSPLWYWQRTSYAKPLIALNLSNSDMMFTRANDGVTHDDHDFSFEIRALRWTVIVKSVLGNTTALLFGFGPGAWGVGVDGYYFRLFGEFGLLGTLAFLWMAARAFRDPELSVDVKEYFVCLLVTGLFIDIFITDKPMSLLWFLVGFSSAMAQGVEEMWAPEGAEAVA